MQLRVGWLWSLGAGIATASVVAAGPLAAQAPAAGASGVVEGRVTEANTGRALQGVQVLVVGTQLGAVSTASGQFRIINVPTRQVEVRARLVGFAPATQPATVTAGAPAVVNFRLQASALQLEQVVVTGTGQQVETKRLGNTVAVIQPPEAAPINSTSEILQGREPGLVGLPSGGLAGEGARIRIRGNASLSQSNEPIVFVDGVRVNSAGGFGTTIGAGGGGTPSRLDDINPESIERIEVLKGAAAATLYGTEASNGVIQIFTKKGTAGAPKWTLSLQQDVSRYPDRVEPAFGFARDSATAARMSYFYGREIRPFEIVSENFFQDYLTETGSGQTVAGSVNGGNQGITYFVSGRYFGEDGPFGGADLGPARDRNRRVQGTMSLDIFPLSNLRLGLRSAYTDALQQTPNNSNNIYAAPAIAMAARPEAVNCTASMDGPADPTYGLTARGSRTCRGPGNPLGTGTPFATVRETLQRVTEQAVGRFTGSIDATYTARPDLIFSATVGLDETNERNDQFAAFGRNVDLLTALPPGGERRIATVGRREMTVDLKGSWDAEVGERWTSSFVAGTQGFFTRRRERFSEGSNFPGPGILVVNGAGDNRDVFESILETFNGGLFAQEQVGYHDWIFGTVGGRYDFSSAFGENAGGVFYPKVSLSVVPTDRPGAGEIPFVSTLRVRAALGRSGRQPDAFAKFTTYAPIVGELGSGLVPQNLGSPDLRPEIATEIEGGFEVGLLENRLGLDFTYWDRTVDDALIPRQFAVSGGFQATQLANIGRIEANGVEIGVRAFPIQRQNFALELFANGAYLKQTMASLGDAPPQKVGYFRLRGFVKEGDPIGALYAPIVAAPCSARPAGATYACLEPGQVAVDINRDGRPDSEADVRAYLATPRDLRTGAVASALAPVLADVQGTGNVLEQYVGKAIPDWSGAFGATVDFLRDWRVSGLFEYRQGFMIQNLTDAFRQSQHPSFGGNTQAFAEVYRALLDPAVSVDDRLAATRTYIDDLRALNEPGLNQIEPGDFIRFRELSLTYSAPQTLAARAGANSLSVTVSGRNLALWTKYSGLDPEINSISRTATASLNSNLQESIDSFGLPLPRRFSIAVNLGF